MAVPKDIFHHIFEISSKLVNATYAEDMKSYWDAYNELRLYCEAESNSGRNHPFLWETLADFTYDPRAAINLYMEALNQATRLEMAEYKASIQIALAERFQEMGERKQAMKFALEANETAKGLDDLDLRRKISEFILKINTVKLD